jgi:hypothetical protein
MRWDAARFDDCLRATSVRTSRRLLRSLSRCILCQTRIAFISAPRSQRTRMAGTLRDSLGFVSIRPEFDGALWRFAQHGQTCGTKRSESTPIRSVSPKALGMPIEGAEEGPFIPDEGFKRRPHNALQTHTMTTFHVLWRRFLYIQRELSTIEKVASLGWLAIGLWNRRTQVDVTASAWHSTATTADVCSAVSNAGW